MVAVCCGLMRVTDVNGVSGGKRRVTVQGGLHTSLFRNRLTTVRVQQARSRSRWILKVFVGGENNDELDAKDPTASATN